MAEVASAYVTLLPSAKGFAKGIQGEIGGDLNRAGTQGGKDYGTGMKAGVAGMATKIFAPLAIAAGALGIGKILSDSITAGSDFQQAVGGADAVFKQEAASIKASAEAAANDLGLPKAAYLELATVLGAGLKNKGIKEFAGSTEDLITVGGDLAAQFGGSTKDAVEAIASAMRGESDPIEKYGVSLNETAVNAKLVEMGLKKVDGRFTEQQKTAGRLALITQQAADAQGAFARESDTYAGSQARLSASWENTKTQIGTALLPALTDLSQWFLTKGLPAVQKFGGWVKDELWPALKDGWETVRPGLEKAKEIIMGAFGGDSGDSVKTFSQFITDDLIPAIATFVNVWLPYMATQLRAAIETVKLVWGAFETWRDVVASVVSFIVGAFITVTEGFQTMLEALGNVPGFGWAKDAADKMQGPIDKAKGIKEALDRIPGSKTVTVKLNLAMNKAYQDFRAGERAAFGEFEKRAKGGPVKAGQPYMVGEKGPELIVPRYHGNVIPNHDLGDGSALASSERIDYARLASVMAGAMSDVRPVVDTRDNARAVSQYQSRRARR
jgi:hypothetical protein